MDNYLITAIILSFYVTAILTEPDLQQQNAAQDQLNPLNDFENADASAKDQDKRTVFNSANYGWAKHVGIKHTGQKYVLGYSPVDLKYTPVIRPLSIKNQGYVYGKPKVHFHLKRPAVQLRPVRPATSVVWRPIVSPSPVVPVNVAPPPHHHHHLLSKPVGVAHVDHVHVKPVHHVDHVHQVQVPHADHVHNVPVHVDHVHQVQVPHVDHVHNVPVHVDHVHPAPIHPVPLAPVHPVPVHPVAVPQPLPQPLVQFLPPPQFVPSPLFEVTRPNLGVLPLGAAFPSPVFRHVPTGPAVVPFPLKPAFVPQQVVPAAVPVHQPVPVPRPAVIPQPLPPQPLYPPGTVVEYHGTTNFLNQIPLPQVPVNAVQPVFPPHFHLQYPQAPQHAQPAPVYPHEQHDVQTPIVPQNHPHFIQHHINQNQFQQQLPLDTSPHFQPVEHGNNDNLFQQQLPVSTQQNHFQPDQDNQQFIQNQPQDSGPRYQPADQVSTQQFFQGSINPQQGNFEQLDNQDGGYIYQQPDVPFGQQSIQPGETDLQLPVHLPQHPGFLQNSRQFHQSNLQESSSQLQSVFRPSIQLEPPYKK